MAWVDSGTINVTANSVTVTGVGTNWLAETIAGVGLVAPDGRLYEVQNVASNTSLTLKKPYRGATATGQQYALAPMQGHSKAVADRLAELSASLQNDYANVLRQVDLQAPSGAPVSGKILQTNTFGLGTRLRAWVAGATAAEPLWIKIATVTGQPNQRAMFQFSGAAFGYGSANGATTGFAVLSATMGNAAQENNLNLEFLYATPENQCAIYGLKTARISNAKFEVWVRARTYSKLMISYSGDMQLVEPHSADNAVLTAPDPAFDWGAAIYPLWTGRTLNPANIGANMGLKSGAFADLIGDVGAGAVMQSGSNANGQWWRFQNGLQLCRLSDLALGWCDAGAGPGGYSGSTRTWTYPASFVDVPAVSFGPQYGANQFWVSSGDGLVNATTATVAAKAFRSIAANLYATCFAVGRWKL